MTEVKDEDETYNDLRLEITLTTEQSEARTKHPTRDGPLTTTNADALMHVVKASLGSGILAMPDAFRNCGLLVGLVGTAVVALLCTHGTSLIVKCSQELCYVHKKPSLGYSETIETAFQHSQSRLLRQYSACARRFVSTFIFFTYYGASTIYVLLIASTLQQVSVHHLGLEWSTRCFMLLLLLPLLPVGMVHQMKYLVPFSTAANFLLLVGLSLTFYFITQDLPSLSTRPAYTSDLTKLPLFFSTVLCGMEGIGTILPIENSMRKPRALLRFPGVLHIAMTIITLLFGSMGYLGYLKYGDDVKGSITLNMNDDMLSELVKVSIALSVFFTFGLQFTACFEVVWKATKPYFSKDREKIAFYTIRALLIAGTVLLGIAVPQLSPVISLVGSVGFSVLGLLMPAVAETVVFWSRGLGWRLWKNFGFSVLAVVALVSGTKVALQDIRENYT